MVVAWSTSPTMQWRFPSSMTNRWPSCSNSASDARCTWDYAATELEARQCDGAPIVVVGGRELGWPSRDVPGREGIFGVRRRASPAGDDDVSIPRRPHRVSPARDRARRSDRHGAARRTEPRTRQHHRSRPSRWMWTAPRCSRSSAPNRTARGSTGWSSTSSDSCSPTVRKRTAHVERNGRPGAGDRCPTRPVVLDCSQSATSVRSRPSESRLQSVKVQPRFARGTHTSLSSSTNSAWCLPTAGVRLPSRGGQPRGRLLLRR